MSKPGASTVFDAVVLSGGSSRRMGGQAKVGLTVGGRPLLARVTGALAGAARVVIVGDATFASRADVVTREDPPGGGPVAAVGAGLAHVRSGVTVLLAGDLPFVTARAVETLVGALGHGDVVLAVDDAGRDQLLCAAWRTSALRAVVATLPAVSGAPMRALTDGVAVRRLQPPGDPPPWSDCDTADELAEARRRAVDDVDMTSVDTR